MVVIGQKWLYSGKSGCFRGNSLYSVKSTCNRAKLLYSGEMVVLGQKWL